MSIVESKADGSLLIIMLSGRVDSSNAADTEAKINDCISAASGFDNVVVDAENLEYISSAGLRIILRLRKEYADLKITNVNSDVYEIFDMTGFTEMIPIEKAYRQLSVEGCEVIGEGSNGKVYRLDPDTIIKVYKNADSLPDIHRERELARKAFVMGIPTAIPYDVVKVGGGLYGSVFELLSAKSLSKILVAEPEKLDDCVEIFVELAQKIHSTELKPGELPSMKEVAVDWAKYLEKYLPEAEYAKLTKLIADVPEDCHMLHGDYHIKNVMIQNGETLLIDMDTLCEGHPIFEFASMFNAFVGFSEVDASQAEKFLGIKLPVATEFLHKSFVKYFGTDDEAKINDVMNKAKVVGYTRLLRRSIKRCGLETPEAKSAYECYRAHLIDAINAVDTLLF